jgi:hypothetical protein
MIYKFKSKAASDVIMLGPNGDQVLRILGRDPAGKGIIESQDMPEAVARIEQAVAEEEAALAKAQAEAEAEGRTLPAREGVSLRQRAWPLVEMMKRSHSAGQDVVWGV